MIEKNKRWMFISVGALVLSFASLLLPVIKYTAFSGDDIGVQYSFNIIKLLDGNTFVKRVLGEYNGEFLKSVTALQANAIIIGLSTFGISAIVLSFVGLRSMSKQYESVWPFTLTLSGIFCTLVPAVALLIMVNMSNNDLYGTIQLGPYAYVTPIAMIVSCITVTKRHQLTREEVAIQRAASLYIRPAGDLPLQ